MLTDTNLNPGGEICGLKCFSVCVWGGKSGAERASTATQLPMPPARFGGLLPGLHSPPPALAPLLKLAAESGSPRGGPGTAPWVLPRIPGLGTRSPPPPAASPSGRSSALAAEGPRSLQQPASSLLWLLASGLSRRIKTEGCFLRSCRY